MEEYDDRENSAPDAPHASDASATTTRGYFHHEPEGEEEDPQQTRYITWPGQEAEKSLILQPVAGNSKSRKMKGKMETRHGVKERATSVAALKMIARQGADEKSQLEEWKTGLMDSLTAKISQLHKMHEEAIEVQREEMEKQREHFQLEIEMLEDKIKELEEKRGGPRQKQKGRERRSTSESQIPEEEERITQSPQKERPRSATVNSEVKGPEEVRSYATVAAARPAQSLERPWTKVNYGNRKPNKAKSPLTGTTEQRGRRILFPRKIEGQHKSEADLMLALNEALQKTGIDPKVRFCRIRYAPSGSISALLTEKADAAMLLPQRSNLLIRAAKSVDDAVVGVEIMEHWQRLKVHGMSLARYLGPDKMELFKREVESSTGIALKAMPRWLVNEDRLKEQQEANNKRGSAIVITVSNDSEAKKLCANGLRFGGAVKVVEKYWEAGPGSVCMRCCGLGHERLGSCGDRPEKCLLCAGPHQASNHQCGVDGCSKKPGKLCTHVVARCANCMGNHQANFARCPARQKAELQARKGKTRKDPKILEKANNLQSQEDEGDEDADFSSNHEMDTQAEVWSKSPAEESSAELTCEGRDYTQDY